MRDAVGKKIRIGRRVAWAGVDAGGAPKLFVGVVYSTSTILGDVTVKDDLVGWKRSLRPQKLVVLR